MPAGDPAPLPAPPVPEGPEDEPVRRRHPVLSEWPIGLVLLGVLAGLIVVASNHFRRGTVVLALSVLFAALLRMMLPERRVGLLAVRSRMIDLLVLGFLGASLTVLALVVPPPP